MDINPIRVQLFTLVAQNLEVEVISSSVPKFEITSRWSLQIRVEEP